MTTEELSYIEKLKERRKYYNRTLPKIGQGVAGGNSDLANTCPSCGYPSIEERCCWKSCSICWWEDDGQDDNTENEICGGPNSDYSLTSYRLAFYRKYKAAKEVSTKNDLSMLVLLNQLELAEKRLFTGNDTIETIKNIISEIDNLPIDQSKILRL